jgi:DNA repair protein RecN (Recombination protein N)
MLKTLRIRDLAIIEDLTVEFGPGLNLLTGETGAGKSIVVDALGLAAGDRADSRLVRSGASRALVDAVFDAARGSGLATLMADRGLDAPDGEIAVRREVAAEGSGRAFVNGTPCALAVLREIGGLLVELHGQHEHQSLLSIERHLDLLDRFGGLEEDATRVEAAHRAVAAAESARDALAARGAEREKRSEELERQLREIDAVGPKEGEFEAWERDRALLRASGRIAELLDALLAAVYDGEPSAVSLAAAAARRASDLAEIDPTLGDLALRLDGARLELEDIGETLRDYRDRAQFDPDRLERAEERLAALERLRLRYGKDEAEILLARGAIAREVETLENLDREAAAAMEALREAEAAYAKAAASLSGARREAAGRLAPAVENQLGSLALGRARIDLAFAAARGRVVRTASGEELPLNARGAERAEFLLAANPGEPARPLSKVASGGELSRVMLALHAVLDGAGEGRVLVFDEVDAGIGGAAADAVGARLARLASRNQILCVTHLPQVAAHADGHYHVKKRVRGGRTLVEIERLDGPRRVDELARMLGGKDVSDASRRNARELLASAAGAGRGRA